jgi:hypothetical protein
VLFAVAAKDHLAFQLPGLVVRTSQLAIVPLRYSWVPECGVAMERRCLRGPSNCGVRLSATVEHAEMLGL